MRVRCHHAALWVEVVVVPFLPIGDRAPHSHSAPNAMVAGVRLRFRLTLRHNSHNCDLAPIDEDFLVG